MNDRPDPSEPVSWNTEPMQRLGIDIGGTGIKGALVDTMTGELLSERTKLDTPQPATPPDVVEVVDELVKRFDYGGPIGCTFPAVVMHGVVRTAANVDDSWIGTDAERLIGESVGTDVTVLNDADAAGVAEIAHGAGRGREGTVLLLTLGTGIGSALFTDGHLVPNTELGHLEVRGKEAEHRASNTTRKEKDLSWSHYAEKLDEVLHVFEALFSPDLFIIGGGISKKSDKFLPDVSVGAPVVPAELLNNAGIVGAAMVVAD